MILMGRMRDPRNETRMDRLRFTDCPAPRTVITVLLKHGSEQGHWRDFMKIEMKSGSAVGDAFDIDLPFMRDHDRIHNAQTQTIAVAGARIVGAVKSLKNVGQMLGWDPDTRILYPNRSATRFLGEAYTDAASFRSVFDRVFE